MNRLYLKSFVLRPQIVRYGTYWSVSGAKSKAPKPWTKYTRRDCESVWSHNSPDHPTPHHLGGGDFIQGAQVAARPFYSAANFHLLSGRFCPSTGNPRSKPRVIAPLRTRHVKFMSVSPYAFAIYGALYYNWQQARWRLTKQHKQMFKNKNHKNRVFNIFNTF